VFAGQNVGTQVGDRIWLVTFMHHDLSYFDDEVGRLKLIANPFGPKVLPMCPEWTVTHVTGIYLERIGSSGWIRTSNPPVNSVMQVVGLAGSSCR
jgi:hypothetical protein